MNFEFSADQMQLKDIARKFLEKEDAVKRARNVLEGEASYDEDLWSQIIEMGFTATAIPEEYGGLGLGYLELCVIAEELGRSLAPTPFSSSVYLASEVCAPCDTPQSSPLHPDSVDPTLPPLDRHS